MNQTLLITFGCSWTYGVGVVYEAGMGHSEYQNLSRDPILADQYSFRGLLSTKYNLDNLNFAKQGSSNQMQFRCATEFFGSAKFAQLKKQYKKIIVLWGITSTARNELYFNQHNERQNFFYTHNLAISKMLLTNHYDLGDEVLQLANRIRFWDRYFELEGITNLWFDTFNHHNYDNEILKLIQDEYNSAKGPEWPTLEKFIQRDFANVPQEIINEILNFNLWNFANYETVTKKVLYNTLEPRDLMSRLAIQNGMLEVDYDYHHSDWKIDSDRVKHLVDRQLLNPISHHPTKQGHLEISKMFEYFFNKLV